MNRLEHLSILMIDDDVELLFLYREFLARHGVLQIECVCLPGEALRHVHQRLFDIVVVDAKLTYKGATLGGLILAEEISTILGSGSVLLISQYDLRNEVSAFNPGLTFLPKPRPGSSLETWVTRDLAFKIQVLVRSQYGFVVMPYSDPDSDRWYRETLVPSMLSAGFTVRRMDQIPTKRPINQELLSRIRQAHFVVVLLPKGNPNVYFEAGYAVALDKYLLLFCPELEKLPFDIRLNQWFRVAAGDDVGARDELLIFMARLRGIELG